MRWSPAGLPAILATCAAALSAQTFDYGDAPAPYPTLVADSGAGHEIEGSWFYFGAGVTADADGQPSLMADTDDGDDGVTGLSDPVVGDTLRCQISVVPRPTAPGAFDPEGFVDAWIDYNRDGDWDDADEHVIQNECAGGVCGSTYEPEHALPVPASAVAGITYARFRLTAVPLQEGDVPLYAGLVVGSDGYGEVEDYCVYLAPDGMDYGDAPDPAYPTLSTSDGARHIIVEGMYMGSSIDSESDGQPNASGSGDDTDGSDDDDGIDIGGDLTQGTSFSATITVSAPGFINAWVDFNADGDWDDADEQVCTDVAVVTGTNTATFSVPAAATPGATFARVRFGSEQGLGVTGLAADGEVEDIAVTIAAAQYYDLGDAPAPYPTLLADNGAAHRPVSDPLTEPHVRLGSELTFETDGMPSAGADADNDDGVAFLDSFVPGQTARITAVVAGSIVMADAHLSSWIDFNGDGDWDDAEDALTLVSLGDITGFIGTETCTLTVDVPASATTGNTYARFRVSSAGLGSPGGTVLNGEVEDYQVTIEQAVGANTRRATPTHTTLYPVRRDPATGQTTLAFYNRTPGSVKLALQTLAGETVAVLANRTLDSGFYTLEAGGIRLSSGTYLVRLVAPDRTITRRVVLAP